ncbi:MAG: GNAT family N-acetyltransferase [Bdellovibrio sp.]|nr:GNAT family N-acetyltransferase [Bdellovibrio sp.]
MTENQKSLNSTENKNFTIRAPRSEDPTEMDALFLSGYDTWNEGRSVEKFLADCRTSKKYAEGRWFVLVDQNNCLASKLIVYPLGTNQYGIGTFATPPSFRGKGYGSRLLEGVLEVLKGMGAEAVFLFSDIDPKFYENFGFKQLPERLQLVSGSVLMSLGEGSERIVSHSDFVPPAYF